MIRANTSTGSISVSSATEALLFRRGFISQERSLLLFCFLFYLCRNLEKITVNKKYNKRDLLVNLVLKSVCVVLDLFWRRIKIEFKRARGPIRRENEHHVTQRFFQI